VNALPELIERGGWVMPVIITLSVLLYARCFRLLLSLGRLRRLIRVAPTAAACHHLQKEARESFRRQRAAIGPMAAPLLGLLGTVSGMEKTFENLSAAAGEKSMEGLAAGISEVLVATQSGLTVAIPAMLLVYLAHRELHRHIQAVNRHDRALGRTGGAA
jgi:biopolymer transport protein ExbB